MTRIPSTLLALLLLTRVPCALADTSAPATRPLLASSLPPLRADARDLGPAPASDLRTIVVSLAPRHPRALSRFLREVRDPASPRRRFLTLEEFIARHAPAERNERALVAYLGRQGLRVTYR